MDLLDASDIADVLYDAILDFNPSFWGTSIFSDITLCNVRVISEGMLDRCVKWDLLEADYEIMKKSFCLQFDSIAREIDARLPNGLNCKIESIRGTVNLVLMGSIKFDNNWKEDGF